MKGVSFELTSIFLLGRLVQVTGEYILNWCQFDHGECILNWCQFDHGGTIFIVWHSNLIFILFLQQLRSKITTVLLWPLYLSNFGIIFKVANNFIKVGLDVGQASVRLDDWKQFSGLLIWDVYKNLCYKFYSMLDPFLNSINCVYS